MIDIREQSRYLSSLAVFRELYDIQKDIYGVISEFLKEIIVSKGKHQFNLTEITNLLNATFDFDIPEAVVCTALGRLDFIERKQGLYNANKSLSKQKPLDVNAFQENNIDRNNLLIEELFSFISQQKNIELTDHEKKRIIHSFYSFLMDDSDEKEYSQYISGFILKNKQNEEFKNNLKKIREGVILYSGLKYNNNLNEVGSWKTELTIYLDTEIIFHFYGFNGELFKTLFEDFFKYVKEINNLAQKRIIKLKYFREVKDEIESFFTKAQYIVEGKDSLNPKMTAMSSIVEGCKAASDVMNKKTDFFLFLNSSGIMEDESTSYFDEKNYEYNIVDQKTIQNISEEYGFDITEHLHYLNYVHIQRKQLNLKNFYNVGYVFLTGNSKTIQVAWHDMIKPGGMVPLATTLSWITNKLWFKLNKGFGNGAVPKSFDIIAKAQIILSFILNESIGQKYDELQRQYKSGNLSEEQVKARIVDLRNNVRKPEDIEQDDVSSIIDVISEDSLEKFLQEQELFKNKAEKQVEENIALKGELTQKEKELENYKKNKYDLTSQFIEAKKMLLQEKQKSIEILESQRRNIDIEIAQDFSSFKRINILVILLIYLLNYYLIMKFGWDKSEQWIWIIYTAFSVIGSALYVIIKEKTINPLEMLKQKKFKIQNDKYKKYNFDTSLLETIKQEIKNLRNEIDKINNE